MIDYSRLNFLAGWLTEERFREIWKRGREEMKKQGRYIRRGSSVG